MKIQTGGILGALITLGLGFGMAGKGNGGEALATTTSALLASVSVPEPTVWVNKPAVTVMTSPIIDTGSMVIANTRLLVENQRLADYKPSPELVAFNVAVKDVAIQQQDAFNLAQATQKLYAPTGPGPLVAREANIAIGALASPFTNIDPGIIASLYS